MRKIWMVAPLGLALLAAGCGESREQRASTGAGEGGAAGPSLSNEEVREAQTVLRDMGLYEGEVDGLYGRRTIAAVGEFQSQNNLPRTRSLDSRTQQRLQQVAAAPPQGQPNVEQTGSGSQEQEPASRNGQAATQPAGTPPERSRPQQDRPQQDSDVPAAGEAPERPAPR